MVRTQHFHCWGPSSVPGWGTKILRKQRSMAKRNKKTKTKTSNKSVYRYMGFLGGAVVENLPANAGDTGSSPGPGRFHMPRSN